MARLFVGCQARLMCVAAVVVIIGGCGAEAPLERAGVALEVPQGWEPVSPQTWPVPGTPLAAWRGPDQSSLVIYTTLPIPKPSAVALGHEMTNRLLNLTGIEVEPPGSMTLDGNMAARVQARGPGLGDCFVASSAGTASAPDGKTLQTTQRVIVAIPRQGPTINLVWHSPVTNSDTLMSTIETMIAGLSLKPESVSNSQSY